VLGYAIGSHHSWTLKLAAESVGACCWILAGEWDEALRARGSGPERSSGPRRPLSQLSCRRTMIWCRLILAATPAWSEVEAHGDCCGGEQRRGARRDREPMGMQGCS
jgi:hypothetical protein